MPASRLGLSPVLAVSLVCTVPAVAAESPLDVETYVQAVLRSHPAARQSSALDAAAAGERKAGRVFPDPVAGFTWDQARPSQGPEGSETGWSVSQTIPWPGTFAANARAADQQAAVFRAEGVATRWGLEIEARSTFARLLYVRAGLEIAREAEADALALKDLTAKRADLGESREVDMIKAEVEWLREQRSRRSLEREADAVETIARNLAVEPLPRPLVLAGGLPEPIPPVDADDLHARLVRANPGLIAAQAAAARETALASLARRGRVPDLDLTWFHDKELDKTATGLQFGVRVPLWNANRGAIARAEAAAALAAAGAERTLLHRLPQRARQVRRRLLDPGQLAVGRGGVRGSGQGSPRGPLRDLRAVGFKSAPGTRPGAGAQRDDVAARRLWKQRAWPRPVRPRRLGAVCGTGGRTRWPSP